MEQFLQEEMQREQRKQEAKYNLINFQQRVIKFFLFHSSLLVCYLTLIFNLLHF
jgi:hypothetical protein